MSIVLFAFTSFLPDVTFLYNTNACDTNLLNHEILNLTDSGPAKKTRARKGRAEFKMQCVIVGEFADKCKVFDQSPRVGVQWSAHPSTEGDLSYDSKQCFERF